MGSLTAITLDPVKQAFKDLAISVADHVSAMLAYWDKDLVCRYANAAYIEWFGKSREEMVDKMTIKELLGPLFEKNYPYIKGALEGKRQTFEREIPTPSEGVRHSLANYFPDIRDGKVHGFFVHVADITPVKLLEKELIRTNAIVQEQNNRLLNFANIVSHNLGNYAGNLQVFLNFLSQADSEKSRQEILGYLRTISANFSETVRNLNEIVNAQNLATLPPVKVRLAEYIVKALDTLKLQIQSSNASVVNNISEDTVILTNPAYMESILMNLLTNAIKYRHRNRPPVIELSSTQEGNMIVLSVKDNGRGIDLERYGKDMFGLYKVFHGNDDARGVGLFITRYQVESMGGDIRVESKENEGTTFFVSFRRPE